MKIRPLVVYNTLKYGVYLGKIISLVSHDNYLIFDILVEDNVCFRFSLPIADEEGRLYDFATSAAQLDKSGRFEVDNLIGVYINFDVEKPNKPQDVIRVSNLNMFPICDKDLFLECDYFKNFEWVKTYAQRVVW